MGEIEGYTEDLYQNNNRLKQIYNIECEDPIPTLSDFGSEELYDTREVVDDEPLRKKRSTSE